MLDAQQDAAVEQLLEPLNPQQRDELTAAMRRIRHALGDSGAPGGCVLRAPEAGDFG